MSKSPRSDVLLRRGLKLSHLRLMAALADTGQLTQAATSIGISQPAASRLVTEIETIIGAVVHERTGRGIGLTPTGRALALRAQRIRLELDDAARDLAEVAAGGVGHVRIGTVTGAALDRVLPALQQERANHPSVTVEVVVAASDALCDQLLTGRLDFALGRLPQEQAQLLSYRVMEAEPLALIVRRGHPLLKGGLTPEAVLACDWLMPGPDSLMTRTVLARLQALGLPTPRTRVSTTSFMLTLALLQNSDDVATVARATALQLASAPNAALAILPLDLGITVEPYGMILRQGVSLTTAAQRLADRVMATKPAPRVA
ncbi:MAG: LysR family transcriptional regulator [Pseudorhodobacter sp.]|nr:LysR family transcriptional regulator [Pseudorhodobacter sp.]